MTPFEQSVAAFARTVAAANRRIEEEFAYVASSLRGIRTVEPTVVSFRPLPTATRHPPWDPESLIVDDLGVAPRRRDRRDR